MNKSLKQRIKEATTIDEIKSLLREGDDYKWASPATRTAWRNTAEKKLNPSKEQKKEKS